MNQGASPASVALRAPGVDTTRPPIWGEVGLKRWESDRTAWLITCVDLTSLLVGFFVLLFSTQTLKQDEWEKLSGSFKAQFSDREIVVPVVPEGGSNAVIRVTTVKSGLAYLDTLFHQRFEKDPLWGQLKAELKGGRQEMAYLLPQEVVQGGVAADAAWNRLGDVLRGWKKNPVGIRVTTSQAQAGQGAATAVALSAKLANSGVVNTFADVTIDNTLTQPQWRLVVLGQ